jgi:hypothetical protein
VIAVWFIGVALIWLGIVSLIAKVLSLHSQPVEQPTTQFVYDMEQEED